MVTLCFTVITYISIYFNHQFSTQEFCISHLQSLMLEKVKTSFKSKFLPLLTIKVKPRHQTGLRHVHECILLCIYFVLVV